MITTDTTTFCCGGQFFRFRAAIHFSVWSLLVGKQKNLLDDSLLDLFLQFTTTQVCGMALTLSIASLGTHFFDSGSCGGYVISFLYTTVHLPYQRRQTLNHTNKPQQTTHTTDVSCAQRITYEYAIDDVTTT